MCTLLTAQWSILGLLKTVKLKRMYVRKETIIFSLYDCNIEASVCNVWKRETFMNFSI